MLLLVRSISFFLVTATWRVHGQDGFSQLESIDWTCLVPAQENTTLDNMWFSDAMADYIWGQMENFTMMENTLVQDMCASSCASWVSPFCSTCLAAARKTVEQTMITHLGGTPECGNWTDPQLAQMCASIQPGEYCSYMVKRERSPQVCGLWGDNMTGVPSACPTGFYCLGSNAPPTVCHKGKYCPEAAPEEDSCPTGTFCVVAGASIPCTTNTSGNFTGTQCIPDSDDVTILPVPCTAGYYCEDGVPNICPTGYFCPEGASAPIKCAPLVTCPEGSQKPERIVRAGVETAIVTAVLVLFSSTVHWWCLDARLWWFRLVLLVIVLAGAAVYDKVMGRKIDFTIFYFAILGTAIAWGFYISPLIQKMVGSTGSKIVDLAFMVGWAFVTGSLTHDWPIGWCFFILGVALLLTSHIVASEMGGRVKLSLLALGFIVALVVIIATGAWVRGVVYVVSSFLLVICDFMLQVWFLFWDERADRIQSRMSQSLLPPTQGAQSSSSQMVLPSLRSTITRTLTATLHEDLALDQSGPVPSSSLTERPTESMELGEVSSGSSFSATKTGISFQFYDVSLKLPSGRSILQDISMKIPSGSVVAIMGPSGCGKSSITNVLSGRAGYGIVKGDISINGTRGRSIKELRNVTGFVPQDDVMHRNLTVEEVLKFQAELRLPWRVGDGLPVSRSVHVQEEVDKVVEMLGLSDPVLRKTRIGDESTRGVSGGQRKRVSIGMALVADPHLLFLDEPTSGLDSTTSHSVVQSFSQASRDRGCTTIAVIHQPRYETLRVFDRVILMAEGGHLVYSGSTTAVEEYFQRCLSLQFTAKENPADTLMDAISWTSAKELATQGRFSPLPGSCDKSDKFGQYLAQKWAESQEDTVPIENLVVTLPKLDEKSCSWGGEVFVQAQRAGVQVQREVAQIIINNFLLIFGVIVLVVCTPIDKPQKEITQMAFALFLLMLTSGVGAQRIFGGSERQVIWREAGSNVKTVLCFVGRDITALFEILLTALFFTAIYWSLGPLLLEHYQMFFVSFATVYAIWGLNYIWSVFMKPDAALMMSVVSAFLCFLLAGMQPAFRDLAEGTTGVFLMALSPIRWAFGILTYEHMTKQSVWTNPMVQMLASEKLDEMSMPLKWINEHQWTCQESTGDRWSGQIPGQPPISFVCSTTQLFILGTYYRVVAILCMLVISRWKSQGGGAVIDATGTRMKSSRILRNVLIVFLCMVTDVEMYILLRTK